MPEAVGPGAVIWFTTDGPPDAPPVLLSNPLGTTADVWDEIVPELAERFRVIRYDQRGHGRSAAPAGPYSMATLGADALAVLDAAGARTAHVAGVSLGGLTAIQLGLEAPARVGRLVLANTGPAIGSAELWDRRIEEVRRGGMAALADPLLDRWLTPGFRAARPECASRLRETLLACPAAGYAACAAAVRDADFQAELPRLEAPVLVIVGTLDRATPPELGRFLRGRIAGAGLVELEAAHLSQVEQPDAFARAVIDFLERGTR